MNTEVRSVPSVNGILEVSLYVQDLERSAQFYSSLFGFQVLERDERFCALGAGNRQVLLLFLNGLSTAGKEEAERAIPPHGARGEIHLAFAVSGADLPTWEGRLKSNGVPIESHVGWSRGGRSIYFRDPDNHSIELATPGTWSVY